MTQERPQILQISYKDTNYFDSFDLYEPQDTDRNIKQLLNQLNDPSISKSVNLDTYATTQPKKDFLKHIIKRHDQDSNPELNNLFRKITLEMIV